MNNYAENKKTVYRNEATKKSARVFLSMGWWCVELWSFGMPDYQARGTYGTGVRLYDSEEQATRAAKRYINR